MRKAQSSLIIVTPQTYSNLLEAIQPRNLRLTRLDDEIYNHLNQEFPELIENPDKIKVLDEDWMKSRDGKERWRKFIATSVFTYFRGRFGL